MIVSIGTRSEPKIIGITRAFSRYPELWNEEESIEYRKIPKEKRGDKVGTQVDSLSGVSCIPMGMTETITGAKNRAKLAYGAVNEATRTPIYGVGLESGMYEVETADSGYFNCSICAIYDGKKYYTGISPSYEYPNFITKRQIQGEEAGFMKDVFQEAKGRKGAVYTLTDGRMYRDEFEETAVIMALTKLVKKDLYEREE